MENFKTQAYIRILLYRRGNWCLLREVHNPRPPGDRAVGDQAPIAGVRRRAGLPGPPRYASALYGPAAKCLAGAPS